jgi:hypothetical protein
LQVISMQNLLAHEAAAGKPNDKCHSAAAHDLDQLQRLAVSERTLAGWIKDTAGVGVTDQWLAGAISMTPEEQRGTVELQAQHQGMMFPASPPPQLLAPLTKAQRAGLRAELAGKCKWSEGVDLLVRYHAAHGRLHIAAHTVMGWAGALQIEAGLKGVLQAGPALGQGHALVSRACPVGAGYPSQMRFAPENATNAAAAAAAGAHELKAAEEGGLVGRHHHAAGTLMTALTEFLQQDLDQASSPPHVAVCGRASDLWLYTGKRWVHSLYRPCKSDHNSRLLQCATFCTFALASCSSAAWALQRLESAVPAELQPAACGLRTVVVNATHFGSLAGLAGSLRQHPRMRFVVVAIAEDGWAAYLASTLPGILASSAWVTAFYKSQRHLQRLHWFNMALAALALAAAFYAFSWPSNALLLAGFPWAPPAELAPVHNTSSTLLWSQMVMASCEQAMI